jgi:hypothetical protein
MIIKLWIYNIEPTDTTRGYFLGESSEICIRGILDSIPVEFYGDTRQEVIEQVKKCAKARFGGGSIRIMYG